MDCPDLDTLIVCARTPGGKGATAEHLSRCARCSDEVGLLRSLMGAPTVLGPIPERLVDRVLKALPDASPAARPEFLPGHAALTFVMAMGTTLLAVLLTGGGGSDPLPTLGVIILVGAVAAHMEPRVLKLSA